MVETRRTANRWAERRPTRPASAAPPFCPPPVCVIPCRRKPAPAADVAAADGSGSPEAAAAPPAAPSSSGRQVVAGAAEPHDYAEVYRQAARRRKQLEQSNIVRRLIGWVAQSRRRAACVGCRRWAGCSPMCCMVPALPCNCCRLRSKSTSQGTLAPVPCLLCLAALRLARATRACLRAPALPAGM